MIKASRQSTRYWRTVSHILIFDVDGVLTHPSEKKVTQLKIFLELKNRLENNEPIILNTGRAIDFIIEKILTPLEKIITDKKLLQNLFAVGEKGGVSVSYDDYGQRKIHVDSSISVPKILQTAARRLTKEKFSDSAFYDITKKTMISIEMLDGLSVSKFKIRQNLLNQELDKMLSKYGLNHKYKIDPSRIATDVENNHVGKALGVERALVWLSKKMIKTKQFIAFGDSPADVSMAQALSAKKLPVIFVFVGEKSLLKNKEMNFPIVYTKNHCEAGTVEYLKKISDKNTSWSLVWSRKYSPFIATSYFSVFSKKTQMWTECKNKLFVPDGVLHGYYIDTKDFKELCQKFEKYILNQNITTFCKRYEKELKQWLEWSKKISNLNFSKITDRKLAQLISILSKKLIYYGEWQFLAFVALEGLVKNAENFIRSYPNLNQFLSAMSVPHRETKIIKSRIELLKIATNSKNLKKDIEKYCKKYPWINMYEFVDKVLDQNDILEKMPTKNEAKSELKKYYTNRKEGLNNFGLLIKKTRGKYNKKLLIAANRFVYLKEVRDDYRRPIFLLIRPLWIEVAKRTGLTLDESNYLLADEIDRAINKPTKKWKKIAHDRMKIFAMELNQGKFIIYSNKKLVDKLIKKVSSDFKNKKIIGSIAFPGEVTGRAKIIYHKDEFKKFVKGDILITAMTHAEFLPIMRQASAIITDEGGITCHAAIVARELKKPCIIGTKIATKTIKDGDMLEIKSEGYIKIIS